MTINNVDLELRILFVAFSNKFINPQAPITTQELISQLMIDYPDTFPSSRKISYTIAALKNLGFIEEDVKVNEEEFNECLKKMREEHPRMNDETIKKKCLKQVGYQSVLLPTRAGVVRFCRKVAPFVESGSGKTNMIIIDVCRNYMAENPPKTTANTHTQA
jgi:hypothetical protein